MSTKINDESKLEHKNFLDTTFNLCEDFFDKNKGLFEELDLRGIYIRRLYDRYLDLCYDVTKWKNPKYYSLSFEEILKRNDAFFAGFFCNEGLSEILADNIAFQKEFEKYLPELSNVMLEKLVGCNLRNLTYAQRKIIDNHEKIEKELNQDKIIEPKFKEKVLVKKQNSKKRKGNFIG